MLQRRRRRREVAPYAVIVDAKDEAARAFCARERFLPLPDKPEKLFRPIASIAKLFE